MAIQMTREEYQQKYGSAPMLKTVSEIDLEPTFSTAPVRMTREEYNARYNMPTAEEKSAETFKPWFPSEKDDSIIQTGLKAVGNVVPSAINLGAGIVQMALNPIDTVKSVVSITKGSGERLGREILEKTEYKDQLPEASTDEEAFNQVMSFFKDNYWGTENLERTVTNDPFGFGIDVLTTITGGLGAIGKLEKAGDVYSKTKAITTAPLTQAFEKSRDLVRSTRLDSTINKRAEEIFSIENGYAKTRRININSPDSGDASRMRIASTDVLAGAVDENGLIRTRQKGGAVEKYRKQTIDGFENIVRQNLEREGAVVNLNEVKRTLNTNLMESNLEGSDLVSALNKVNKEIEGLSLKADEFGNVPLTKLHDAKISTYANIDFTKPVSANYRRTLASTYKELIENKSELNIREINSELGKYYDDIRRLEELDGKRVKGGKLGKYFAQVTGNMAGGIAGSVGGPLGTVVGTVVGGEISTALKGSSLAKTFGKELGLTGEKNAILEVAKETGTLPLERSLKVADPQIGALKNIPKTDEIVRIEGLIKKNIKDQKKAIGANDYTLVSGLKDIYNSLVESLVDEIQKTQKTSLLDRIKNTPNKQGGFIKVGKQQEKGLPKSKVNESVSSSNNSTLFKEAKKYKSAEEFVDSNFSIAGRLNNDRIDMIFNALPDGTTGEKGFVKKIGDKLYPTEKATPEILENSMISLNKDGSIKEGFLLNRAGFTEGVVTKSQLEQIWKEANK